MDLDTLGPDRSLALSETVRRPESVEAAAPSVREALSQVFDGLYGANARSAEQAFAAAVRRDGLAAASETMAERPEQFGETVGLRASPAVALALGQALAGAPGHTPGLPDEAPARAEAPLAATSPADGRRGRGPDPLGRVLEWMYDANESTLGTVVGAVGSFVPGLDTALDVADVGLNVWRVSQPEHRRDPEAWINLGTTAVGMAIPLAGDTVEAALKAVLRGGGAAAHAAMRTLGPALRRAGLDPVRYLNDLADQVPRLLTRGLDAGVSGLQGALRGLGARDRLLVPDWVEEAAGPAAQRLGALADGVRQPLQNVADQIRGAFRALAVAAGDGTRRNAGDAAGDAAAGARRGATGGTPDGPDRPRRTPDVPQRTRPTGEIGDRPTGTRQRVNPRDDADTQWGHRGENDAADTLAARGYRVEQRPVNTRPDNSTRPDYLIEGHYADAYTPRPATSPRNIASTVQAKVDKGQADRIVLNLDGWQGDLAALRRQFANHPMPGLQEVLVTRGGQVAHLTLAR